MITQQQALDAAGCAYACARAANLRGPIYEYLTQVRQYIEQRVGAQLLEDVGERQKAIKHADQLERALMEILNGTRKPGKLPMEPMVALANFARTGTTKMASIAAPQPQQEQSK